MLNRNKLKLLVSFVFITSMISCDSSYEVNLNSQNSEYIEDKYNAFYEKAKKRNTNNINNITTYSRSEIPASYNQSLIGYLISLPESELDSLFYEFKTYENYTDIIDSLSTEANLILLDSIGANELYKFNQFIESYAQDHSFNSLAEATSNKKTFVKDLYIAAAAEIDADLINDISPNDAIMNPKAAECYYRLIGEYGRGYLFSTLAGVLTGIFSLDFLTLISAGYDIYSAIEMVRHYHDCLRNYNLI